MKKNLKAIVSIILVLGLLVCLTGCGENEKKQEAIDQMIEWFHSVQDWTVEIGDALNAEFGG